MSCRVSYQRIHANEEEEAQLRSCYASALSLCTEKNIRSVAFPSLGTRGHRYPLSEAAKVGVKAVVDMLKEKGDSFDRVVLCTHNGKDTEVIKKTIEVSCAVCSSHSFVGEMKRMVKARMPEWSKGLR